MVRLTALGAYAVLWSVLSISPRDRAAWALENVLVVAFGLSAWLLRRRVSVSNRTWMLTLLFLSLHAIGAHYTYAETPYEEWIRALTGTTLRESFGIHRNHYDRFVHFASGLLLTGLVREVAAQLGGMRGPSLHVFALTWVMAASLGYELIEWAAAVIFGGDLGVAYLGTQGDEWDAHKDMALATAGALLATGISLWRSRSERLQLGYDEGARRR